MFLTILTVLGFLLSLLSWVGISPARFGRTAHKYVFKSWVTGFSAVAFCTNLVVLIFVIRSGASWWVYLSLSWALLFLSSMHSSAVFTSLKVFQHIFNVIQNILPGIDLVLAFAILNYALTLETASVKMWTYIAMSTFLVFLAGGIFATNLLYAIIGKRFSQLEQLFEAREQVIVEFQTLKNVLVSRQDANRTDDSGAKGSDSGKFQHPQTRHKRGSDSFNNLSKH